jgi:HEAT repeat protein
MDGMPIVLLLGVIFSVFAVFVLALKVIKKKKTERRILKAKKKIDDAIASKDVHALISFLKNRDIEIPLEIYIEQRKKIIDGFRKIGLPAIESLVAILQDINSLEREAAAGILGEIGDRRATEPLIQIVQNAKLPDQTNLQERAMMALGELGDNRAVAPLLEVAENDPDANQRVIAGCALGRLGDPRSFDILMNLLQIGGTHLNWGARYNGVYALGKIGDSRAIPLLVDHLAIANLGAEEFKDEVRLAAATALAGMGEPALEILIAVIDNPESESRHYACYALGWMENERALPGLEKLMRENRGSIRAAAGYAIDMIKKKQQTV